MRLEPAVAEMLEPWFPSLPLRDVRIVTRGPVCWFVRVVLHKSAMAFSPFVFFGRSDYEPASLRSVSLLAHELKHIEQYRRHGHFLFLLRYFWHLARNGLRYSRDLPLEAEAYDLQDDVEDALRDTFA